ncbi:MAG: hypothetical protein NDI93_04755 [Pseudomonas sp.]|nr:hypothetical protein [Pseudomonas sp.]
MAVEFRLAAEVVVDSSLEPEDAASRTLVDQWASALITTVDTRLIRRYLLKVAGPRVAEPLAGPALAQAEQAVDRTLAVLEGEPGERNSSAAPAIAWPTPCWHRCSTT